MFSRSIFLFLLLSFCCWSSASAQLCHVAFATGEDKESSIISSGSWGNTTWDINFVVDMCSKTPARERVEMSGLRINGYTLRPIEALHSATPKFQQQYDIESEDGELPPEESVRAAERFARGTVVRHHSDAAVLVIVPENRRDKTFVMAVSSSDVAGEGGRVSVVFRLAIYYPAARADPSAIKMGEEEYLVSADVCPQIFVGFTKSCLSVGELWPLVAFVGWISVTVFAIVMGIGFARRAVWIRRFERAERDAHWQGSLGSEVMSLRIVEPAAVLHRVRNVLKLPPSIGPEHSRLPDPSSGLRQFAHVHFVAADPEDAVGDAFAPESGSSPMPDGAIQRQQHRREFVHLQAKMLFNRGRRALPDDPEQFCLVQLLCLNQAPDYYLVLRSGRVGTSGVSTLVHCESEAEGVAQFFSQVNSKRADEWELVDGPDHAPMSTLQRLQQQQQQQQNRGGMRRRQSTIQAPPLARASSAAAVATAATDGPAASEIVHANNGPVTITIPGVVERNRRDHSHDDVELQKIAHDGSSAPLAASSDSQPERERDVAEEQSQQQQQQQHEHQKQADQDDEKDHVAVAAAEQEPSAPIESNVAKAATAEHDQPDQEQHHHRQQRSDAEDDPVIVAAAESSAAPELPLGEQQQPRLLQDDDEQQDATHEQEQQQQRAEILLLRSATELQQAEEEQRASVEAGAFSDCDSLRAAAAASEQEILRVLEKQQQQQQQDALSQHEEPAARDAISGAEGSARDAAAVGEQRERGAVGARDGLRAAEAGARETVLELEAAEAAAQGEEAATAQKLAALRREERRQRGEGVEAAQEQEWRQLQGHDEPAERRQAQEREQQRADAEDREAAAAAAATDKARADAEKAAAAAAAAEEKEKEAARAEAEAAAAAAAKRRRNELEEAEQQSRVSDVEAPAAAERAELAVREEEEAARELIIITENKRREADSAAAATAAAAAAAAAATAAEQQKRELEAEEEQERRRQLHDQEQEHQEQLQHQLQLLEQQQLKDQQQQEQQQKEEQERQARQEQQQLLSAESHSRNAISSTESSAWQHHVVAFSQQQLGIWRDASERAGPLHDSSSSSDDEDDADDEDRATPPNHPAVDSSIYKTPPRQTRRNSSGGGELKQENDDNSNSDGSSAGGTRLGSGNSRASSGRLNSSVLHFDRASHDSTRKILREQEDILSGSVVASPAAVARPVPTSTNSASPHAQQPAPPPPVADAAPESTATDDESIGRKLFDQQQKNQQQSDPLDDDNLDDPLDEKSPAPAAPVPTEPQQQQQQSQSNPRWGGGRGSLKRHGPSSPPPPPPPPSSSAAAAPAVSAERGDSPFWDLFRREQEKIQRQEAEAAALLQADAQRRKEEQQQNEHRQQRQHHHDAHSSARYRLIKPNQQQLHPDAEREVDVHDIRTAEPFCGFSLEDSNTPTSKDLSVFALWLGSPADRAGLRLGDRVTHMNGIKLTKSLRVACRVFSAVAVAGDSLILRVKPCASSGSRLARLVIMPILTADARFESTFNKLYFNLARSVHIVSTHHEVEPEQLLFEIDPAHREKLSDLIAGDVASKCGGNDEDDDDGDDE